MQIPESRASFVRKVLGSLFIIYGDEQAQRFADLRYALQSIKSTAKKALPWQAAASIAVHAFALTFRIKGEEHVDEVCSAALDELADEALEPLERCHRSLTNTPKEEENGEGDKLLAEHVRLALGLLLFAKGDVDRSKSVLLEIAPLHIAPCEGERFDWAVSIILEHLLTDLYLNRGDHEEAVYLLARAARNLPEPSEWPTFARLAEVLDLWAGHCEQTRELAAWDALLKAAYSLQYLGEADEPAAREPSECGKHTASFLAWQYGQLVARLALRESERYGELIDRLGPSDGASLLFERGAGQALPQLRADYLRLWRRAGSVDKSDIYSVLDISGEYGTFPWSDRYWAMKIGFADKLMEATATRSIVPVGNPVIHVVQQLGDLREILSTVALRQIKQEHNSERRHQEVLGRLSASRDEVVTRLREHLGAIWTDVPAKVANTMVKAERYYLTHTNDDDAKVWYFKSVEASLAHCFVLPLLDFMTARNSGKMPICFPASSGGIKHMSREQISKISPRDWGEVFLVLASGDTSLAALGKTELMEFVKTRFGSLDIRQLVPLANDLRLLQDLRGGSAHYRDADSRYTQEQRELEDMRGMVLGISRPSVIATIFPLFRLKA